MERTIDVTNSSANPRRVWVEPWCSDHLLSPGQTLRIVIEHSDEPTFELEESEAQTIVWLNQHSAAYIMDHGVRRTILDCWCRTPASPTGTA